MTLRPFRWGSVLPEALLLAALLFFALRLLGTFPSAWSDDGLFMIVSKMVAQGRGYVLPVLGWDWPRPYILAVGPTLILPAALAIKIAGFSVAVARIPMVAYLLAALSVTYLYSRKTFGVQDARWTSALLLSLSAFINTGKPVLGEVPGYFYLILGVLLLSYRSKGSAVAAGVALGLAVVTKLPFAILFPALGIVWGAALVRRQWTDVRRLTLVGTAAALTVLGGAYWLGAFESGFFREIALFVLGEKGSDNARLFEPILSHPMGLVRFAYIHYLLVAILACVGWWKSRSLLGTSAHLFLGLCTLFFALYFIIGPGWYRHLLPSTLLLLPFVPLGARTMLGKNMGVLLLIALVAAQGVWQLQMRGSSADPHAQLAAAALSAKWTDTKMIIVDSEVFVRVSENPNWLFFTDEMRESTRRPAEVQKRIDAQRCLPVLRRMRQEELDARAGEETQVSGRYYLLLPTSDCARDPS